MKIDCKDFRVDEDKEVDLKEWSTNVAPYYDSKKDYKTMLRERIDKLSDLQTILYAADSYSLLVIFQAMDAAGKDSAIKHVMSGVNPQGCQVYSFKHPSLHELDHDFLWRTNQCLPERGRIGIFNRSYYEEVLIVRVHPELLRSQRIPNGAQDEKKVWDHRYQSIRHLEAHLHRNGTRIIKFFLHLSKEEQRKRFLARIDEPDKNWKFNMGDMKERELWSEYMNAYEACLSATSTRHAPWYVVPADDKANTRLIVSEIIVDTLRDLPIDYPKLSEEQLEELRKIRKLLEK